MNDSYKTPRKAADHEGRIRETIQRVAVETNGSLTAIEDACFVLDKTKKDKPLSPSEIQYMADREIKRQMDNWGDPSQ